MGFSQAEPAADARPPQQPPARHELLLTRQPLDGENLWLMFISFINHLTDTPMVSLFNAAGSHRAQL